MTTKQPQPKQRKGPRQVDVTPLVQADLSERSRKGIQTYGVPLRTHNGRNALWDAYEELLDAAKYIRQEIEEKRDKERTFTNLLCEVSSLRGKVKQLERRVKKGKAQRTS